MPDVRHFETIDDIDREAWDALAPGSRFYQSHAWLRGQERPSSPPRVTSPSRPTADSSPGRRSATPSESAPPLPDVSEGHTVLRLGTRTGYHNEFLLPKDPGTAEEALDALVAGAARGPRRSAATHCSSTSSPPTVCGCSRAGSGCGRSCGRRGRGAQRRRHLRVLP